MKLRSVLTWVLAIIVSIGLLSLSACKKKNRDGEIQTAFNSKVQTDPNLAGVSATVLDGTVTLTGTCADESCRTNAESSVKSIDGVKSVVNNIQVAKVIVTEDDTLRNNATELAKKYDGVQADVVDGVVTLRGTIASREKLQELMQEVSALRPKRVDNQLVIKK